MRRAFKFILCLIIISCITGCDGYFSYGGFSPRTYNCVWHNDKNAILIDPQLLAPCNNTTNGCAFENERLKNSLNTWSLLIIMEDILNQNIGSSFSFKWTISLTSNKLCSDQTKQSQSIVFNQNNYKSYLSFVNSDVLSKSLYVAESDNFTAYDHKHEMVFQIFDIENTYEGKVGTMTWKVNWDQPSIIEYENWLFVFPKQGVVGTFSPNNYQSGEKRYIYINGNYEFI